MNTNKRIIKLIIKKKIRLNILKIILYDIMMDTI